METEVVLLHTSTATYNPNLNTIFKKSTKKENIEATITSFNITKERYVLVGIYRPPNALASWFSSFNDLLHDVYSLGKVIVMGDTNADLLKPMQYPGKSLLSSLDIIDAAVPDTTPTRICKSTATCIDIIAIPTELVIRSYSVDILSASDHQPIIAEVEVNLIQKPTPIIKRSYAKTNFDQLGNELSNITLVNSDDPERLLANWTEEVMSLLDQHAPIKQFPMRRHSVPWMTEEIKEMITQKDSYATKIRHGDKSTVLFYTHKLHQRKVKSSLRKSCQIYGTELLANNRSADTWKFIRQITFTEAKYSVNGVEPEDLNNHFANVVKSSSNEPVLIPPKCDAPGSFHFDPVSIDTVYNLLKNISSTSSMGCDDLPAVLLKKVAQHIALNLTRIFNCSFTSNTFPSSWKLANVSSIWKEKGSKTDPCSYRPISVLPIIGRILEKICASQLYDYCITNKVIPNEQYGFRPKSSCETALMSATDTWMKQIDQGNIVGALLIDLSKAFDTVPHQKLLIELSKIGLSESALSFFLSYLSDRQQRVMVNSGATEWKSVSRGVPQESCLSPLLLI